jgi:hypothetical protein
MDPYLEDPAIFPDLHDSAITYLRESLQARLPPGYYAALGSRVWIEESRRYVGPDVDILRRGNGVRPGEGATGAGVALAPAPRSQPVVIRVLSEEMRENFVEVYARDGRRLVTVIEVLSLSNKTPGEQGRDLYRQKQREVLRSQAHLVEIDLLRGGEHATAVPQVLAVAQAGPFDYHVCIHHYDNPPDYFVYAVRLPDRLPEVAVPLLPGEPPVPFDLQALLDRCYDAGAYGGRVAYAEARPVPPLRPQQTGWATQVLREKGLLPAAGDA